jgi:hypothetical protein
LLSFGVQTFEIIWTSPVIAQLEGSSQLALSAMFSLNMSLITDFTGTWDANIAVLVPALGCLWVVDDTVNLTDWCATALAVDSALALIQIVCHATNVSGSVTRNIAMLTWFFTFAFTHLGGATAFWFSWSVNDNAVVGTLWLYRWAAGFTFTLGTSTTVLRVFNVLGELDRLVHALASWIVIWEGSLTLFSSIKVAIFTGTWDAVPEFAALIVGNKLLTVAYLAHLLWRALGSKVVTEEGTVLVTLTWLATIVVLVPCFTIVSVVLGLVSTLQRWAVTVLLLAIAYVLSGLNLTAVAAYWLDDVWALWLADTLLLRTALGFKYFTLAQVFYLAKFEASRTCWGEWQVLFEVNIAVNQFVANTVPAFVFWTAHGFLIIVANLVMLFPWLAITFLDRILAFQSFVDIGNIIVTVASVNMTDITIIPGVVFFLNLSLASNWIDPFALSAYTLEKSLARWFTWTLWYVFVDWTVVFVGALGRFLAFLWLTDALVSAASWAVLAKFFAEQFCFYRLIMSVPWHAVDELSYDWRVFNNNIFYHLLEWMSTRCSELLDVCLSRACNLRAPVFRYALLLKTPDSSLAATTVLLTDVAVE